MKVITKEEEDAHYSAVLRGGLMGGAIGLGVGSLALWGAYRRYPAVRNLTPQFRVYLVSSVGTFGAITWAERNSIAFGRARDPHSSYKDQSQRYAEQEKAAESTTQRALEWARQNRYTIVGGSWVASIAAALAIVSRNKYLTTGQKVVHSRVYAQGLTIAVLMLTGLLEVTDAQKGKGRWETVKVLDPNDPEHKRMIEKRIHHEEYAGQDLWMDMVAAEERRMNERKAKAVAEIKEKDKAEKKAEKSKAPAS